MDSIIYEDGKTLCGECKQIVSKDHDCKLSFCPRCGNPLNINALEKFEEKVNHEKIFILYEAIDEITDGADALEVLNRYIKELK